MTPHVLKSSTSHRAALTMPTKTTSLEKLMLGNRHQPEQTLDHDRHHQPYDPFWMMVPPPVVVEGELDDILGQRDRHRSSQEIVQDLTRLVHLTLQNPLFPDDLYEPEQEVKEASFAVFLVEGGSKRGIISRRFS